HRPAPTEYRAGHRAGLAPRVAPSPPETGAGPWPAFAITSAAGSIETAGARIWMRPETAGPASLREDGWADDWPHFPTSWWRSLGAVAVTNRVTNRISRRPAFSVDAARAVLANRTRSVCVARMLAEAARARRRA